MSFDYSQTILSQYATGPTIAQLISNMAGYFDPSANINAFYSNVMDILNARGYGLNVWGRILGVERVLQVAAGDYFGFTGVTGPGNGSGDSFGGGPVDPGMSPFFHGGDTTSNFSLTDSAYRVLLLAKAAANISDGSVPTINSILMALFVTGVSGRTGNAYCTDGHDMTMTYTFDIDPVLSPVEYAIINQSGALPRSSGVLATVVQI